MKKKELLKKIEKLEHRVQELEARPIGWYYTYPYYYYPRIWHGITDPPWVYTPTITSGSWTDSSGDTTTAYTTENITFTSDFHT